MNKIINNINLSDWISIFFSLITLFAMGLIAHLQIKQNNRMGEFEKRQDLRDEHRHKEKIDSETVSFILKHYKTIELLPLCAIATMYNRVHPYEREMYRDFCSLTVEVQNNILKYANKTIRVRQHNNFYDICLKKLIKIYEEKFPNEDSPFYEYGKYISESIEEYGSRQIPDSNFEYDDYISDIVSEVFRADGEPLKEPISVLNKKYEFRSGSEIKACQYVTTLARYIAMYNKRNDEDDEYIYIDDLKNDGSFKMEDLFLVTMFYIYTCVRNEEEK